MTEQRKDKYISLCNLNARPVVSADKGADRLILLKQSPQFPTLWRILLCVWQSHLQTWDTNWGPTDCKRPWGSLNRRDISDGVAGVSGATLVFSQQELSHTEELSYLKLLMSFLSWVGSSWMIITSFRLQIKNNRMYFVRKYRFIYSLPFWQNIKSASRQNVKKVVGLMKS